MFIYMYVCISSKATCRSPCERQHCIYTCVYMFISMRVCLCVWESVRSCTRVCVRASVYVCVCFVPEKERAKMKASASQAASQVSVPVHLPCLLRVHIFLAHLCVRCRLATVAMDSSCRCRPLCRLHPVHGEFFRESSSSCLSRQSCGADHVAPSTSLKNRKMQRLTDYIVLHARTHPHKHARMHPPTHEPTHTHAKVGTYRRDR